jgi:deferrochelatase/peroxidase EfeB
VWVAPGEGPAWLDGGTYLVARRIRMHVEIWDRTSLSEQEIIIGRTKGVGAPIGAAAEFDEADLSPGGPIDVNAHIRLASAEQLGGVKILRRGYNFVDGSDGQGHLNAGLFFVAFMRDPHAQFVPMQRALARSDVLMEYIEHTGSAVFACPAGLGEGAYWGQSLLEA